MMVSRVLLRRVWLSFVTCLSGYMLGNVGQFLYSSYLLQSRCKTLDWTGAISIVENLRQLALRRPLKALSHRYPCHSADHPEFVCNPDPVGSSGNTLSACYRTASTWLFSPYIR